MIIEWLLGAVAAVGAIIIVLLIAVFFIASAFMLLAAKIVRVENATYGRAILATFLGTLVALAITIPLSFLGPPGTVLGAKSPDSFSRRSWLRQFSRPVTAKGC